MPKLIEIPEAVKGYANTMVYEHFTQHAQRKPEHHYPECIVIYHAKALNSFAVLIDENAARSVAKAECLMALNHVGLLREAVKANLVSRENAMRRFKLGLKNGNRYKNQRAIIEVLGEL